jgi:hypothetical protein
MPKGWSGHDFGGQSCLRGGRRSWRSAFAAGVLATNVRQGREIMITQGTQIAGRSAARVVAAPGSAYGTRAQTALRSVLAIRRILRDHRWRSLRTGRKQRAGAEAARFRVASDALERLYTAAFTL